MRVLALDTTTRGGSLAVVEDDRVLAERAGDAMRSHAERLPGDLVDLLRHLGIAMSSIDVFAVAIGPGSFTGLRIGIATIQGLAFVQRRPIAPVSALEALAHAGAADMALDMAVGAWMDAHRHDVFSALYRVRAGPAYSAARLQAIDPPSVGDPAATLARWQALAPPAVILGDGAVLYGALIGPLARAARAPALAGIIGRVAVARRAQGASGLVDPAAVQPLYVRRPDAELAREQAMNTGR